MQLIKIEWLVICVLLLGLSACYEDHAQFKVHEPGEYRGASDPLLQVSKDGKQQERLQARLQQVQTDR